MGKELIFKALRHETVSEMPWVPFAGVHAGKLKGYSAEDMLKNADYIVESLCEVVKMYSPDGMPIIFDLQVEAEILGCELLWAKNNPPSVKSHPLSGEKKIPEQDQIPSERSGRLPAILDAMKRTKAAVGDDVALYGLICGPFTLASHLRGSEIFMDMIKDPNYVRELIEFCSKVAVKMSKMYIEAGMDVIAVVDPLVSQVSPKHIRSMMSESFKTVFDFIRSEGAYSSFFVCGNATNQIEAMCEMGPDGIAVDENVNLAQAKVITDKYNICIGGNIPLTTTMLLGTQQDNMKSVIDLVESIDSSKNFILSPGCDMPYDTPIENTVACAQAAKKPESAKRMLENYTAKVDDIEVIIPDYKSESKVVIELFLLDPEQCAACTYMLNSVVDAFQEIKDIAEYRVYKYYIREDIARTAKMGIKNLPTMCVDGDIKWVSIIPSREEFVSTIKEYAAKKN
ncbi:MAG: uroporphyrinogen decarboxylase family protein [Eubacteriales bacterium]